jgi:hypothetical protein
MTVAEIARQLGLRKVGQAWRGACPLCGGKTRFQLREGRNGPLIWCWHGCDRKDLLAELRRRGLLPKREQGPLTPGEKATWARAQRQARDLAMAARRWWRERVAELDGAAARAVDLEAGRIDTWALAGAANEVWKLRSADAAGVIEAYRRALETDREHTLRLVREGADWDLTAERWCRAVVAALGERQKKGATSHGIAA